MELKNRKGISINRLLLMVGGLMFAGLIGTLYTQSPLAGALMQGSDMVDNSVDYTIDISSDDDLSDLAMFTYHRASRLGCSDVEDELTAFEGGTVHKQNEGLIESWKYGNPDNKGYPGLQDSYLGKYPDCSGAGETAIRGTEGVAPAESGQDMEGIYSREQFEIQDTVVLEAGFESEGGGRSSSSEGGERGDTWLEKNFMVASKDSFEKRAKISCGADIGGTGTGVEFALYFEPEPSNNRALPWMDNTNDLENKNPYCADLGDSELNIQPFMESRGDLDKPSTVVLCPGDKGYIQMNKWGQGQSPTHDGEASLIVDNSYKAGFIQITELSDEDCGTAVPQIPEDENSIGNVFRINVKIGDGWGTLKHFDLHQVEDEERFYGSNSRQDVVVEDNVCNLLVRERDPVNSENGVIDYRQGTKIGQSQADTFPNLDSASVKDYSFPDDSNAALTDHGASTIYTGENLATGTNLESWNGLDAEGFTGVKINRDLPFAKNIEGDSTFQPYGDMLCTKADTDEDEDSSNARWIVCDESNYESPTTVEVEHFNGDREYRCSPGSGDWEIQY